MRMILARFFTFALCLVLLTACGPRFEILGALDRAYTGPACFAISEGFPFTLPLNSIEMRRRRMAAALTRVGILARIDAGHKTAVYDTTAAGKKLVNQAGQICYGQRQFIRLRKLSETADPNRMRVEFVIAYDIDQRWAYDEAFRGYIPLGHRILRRIAVRDPHTDHWHLQ